MRVPAWLKKYDLLYILPLIAIALYPRLRYFFTLYVPGQGLPRAHDTAWYIEHANAFLSRFSIDMHYNGIFYFSYYSLLALLLLLFKSETAVVLVQLFINALSVALVYKIAAMLFSRRAAIFAGFLYAFTWSVIEWSMFILSDSFFISLLLLNVYLLLTYYRTRGRKYLFLFMASAVYMIFFRPTGIITLTFICAYIMINLNWYEVRRFCSRRKTVLAAGGLVLAAGAAAVVGSGILQSLFASFKWSIMWILYTVYANGQIFDVPTLYDYKFNANRAVNYFDNFFISYFINNGYHILVMYARKAVFFWSFSLKNLLQQWEYQAYYFAAYFFGAAGLIGILRHRMLKRTSVLLLVIFSIQVFCIIFFMDSSYRYRTPALVFLNMIAGYGMDRAAVFGQAVLHSRKK